MASTTYIAKFFTLNSGNIPVNSGTGTLELDSSSTSKNYTFSMNPVVSIGSFESFEIGGEYLPLTLLNNGITSLNPATSSDGQSSLLECIVNAVAIGNQSGMSGSLDFVQSGGEYTGLVVLIPS